jgi:hypothetical protein
MLLLEGMFGLRGLGSLPEVLYPAGIAWGDAWRLLVGRHLETLHVLACWPWPGSAQLQQIMGGFSPSLARAQLDGPAALRAPPSNGC